MDEQRNREADQELVERARDGDRDAFGDLYELHYPAVFRLARFYLDGAAEDAAAETFVRAWAALPRYRDKGVPFVAWLYGIARHVVTDELRSRSRVETREALPDSSFAPSYEERIALASAIARLPRAQRRIIEMKYLVGLTNPEVAAALGKSIGAVNAQQWRALQALRRMLEST